MVFSRRRKLREIEELSEREKYYSHLRWRQYYIKRCGLWLCSYIFASTRQLQLSDVSFLPIFKGLNLLTYLPFCIHCMIMQFVCMYMHTIKKLEYVTSAISHGPGQQHVIGEFFSSDLLTLQWMTFRSYPLVPKEGDINKNSKENNP